MTMHRFVIVTVIIVTVIFVAVVVVVVAVNIDVVVARHGLTDFHLFW